MEVKLNDWVIIKRDISPHLIQGYATKAFQENIPLRAYLVGTETVYCITDNLAFNNYSSNAFTIDKKYIEKISITKANQLAAISNKKYIDKSKIFTEKLKVKHIPINDRKDYNLESKLLLQTCFNTANICVPGIIKSKDYKIPFANIKNTQCCSFTKTTNDIIVYIPKTWINYFGYNLSDLKAYLKFLEGCDINFKAEILDTVSFFKYSGVMKEKKYGVLSMCTNNFYLKSNELAYRVLIPSGKSSYLTYLYFILVRYIYNNSYWNIPFIAMKLKKNMPNASNWDCLLLAHSAYNYNAYYSLAGCTNLQTIIPGKEINTPKKVVSSLSSGRFTMNASFTLRRTTEPIRKMIFNENYKELQTLLDNYKKNDYVY